MRSKIKRQKNKKDGDDFKPANQVSGNQDDWIDEPKFIGPEPFFGIVKKMKDQESSCQIKDQIRDFENKNVAQRVSIIQESFNI